MERRRLFGTNGVRGIVNDDLTSEFALRLGQAIGTFMKGTVAIGSDTRTSVDMIRSAAAAGLMCAGCDILDLGIVPTPALQYFVKTHDVGGGVMITASHNPPEFNGIKCVSSDGTEMSRDDEERIDNIFFEDMVRGDRTGTTRKIAGAAESYIDAIVGKVDSASISSAGLTAVLDCANGAACVSAPLLLKKLGVKAITLNADPQGEFPGHPSEPTEENLSDLIRLTAARNADIGIAHDGDADRTVFVSNKGEFVSGDKSLALLSVFELERRPGVIVTPVSTSSVVEDVVKKAGGTVKYTAVGSPIVARAMMSSGAVFGGEENGGLIFPEHQYCRDGAMTVAKMLECIAKKGSLSEQAAALPAYHTFKFKISCRNDMKAGLLAFLSAGADGIGMDETDGLKIIYEDGWVLVRPSGTEPIFRIYSESKDAETAERRGTELVRSATAFMTVKENAPQ